MPKCIKCKGEYEQGEMRAAGGFWTKIFNIQNKKFTTLSCIECGYTELYNKKSNSSKDKAENILDFFT
jgi:hypothetical protein